MLRRKKITELEEWMSSEYTECILLKGARRTGKTFLIEHFLRSNGYDHLKIDFGEQTDMIGIFDGDLSVDRIIEDLVNAIPGFDPRPYETILFFDEIQLCERAYSSLRYFAKDGRYRVISTGSLLGITYPERKRGNGARGGNRTLLPMGDVRNIVLEPLDFEEFLWAIGIDERGTSSVRRHIRDRTPLGRTVLERYAGYFSVYSVVGGMPEAVNVYLETKRIGNVRRVQQKLIAGYRDDAKRYADVSDQDKIAACFDSIPVHLGQDNKKFMYSRIDANFVPTYDAYAGGINWMCDAGIVRRCTNLEHPHLPLREYSKPKEFKIYMSDTGLLVCMLGLDTAHSVMNGDPRVNRGAVAENVVSQCLQGCGLEHYYFNTGSMEIDFITAMRGEPVAIGVKSGNNNRSQSLRSVRDRYGVKRRMKFENTDVFVDKEDVEHYPLFAGAFADSMYEPYDIDIRV